MSGVPSVPPPTLREAVRYRGKYPLGGGVSVEFVIHRGTMECVWSPAMPIGKAARKLLPHYRKARNAFLRSLPVSVMVVEV